jgi:hypothetical protein
MHNAVALERPDLTAAMQGLGQRRCREAPGVAVRERHERGQELAEHRHGRMGAVVVAAVPEQGERRGQWLAVRELGATLTAEVDAGIVEALMVGATGHEGGLDALDQDLGIRARLFHKQPRHLADQAPADQAMVTVDLQTPSRPPAGTGAHARRRRKVQRDARVGLTSGGPCFGYLFALH